MRFVWYLHGICLKFAWNVPVICQRYVEYMHKKWLRFSEIFLRLPEVCLRFAWDMAEICLICAWDMPEIWLKYTWDMSEICLRYAWDRKGWIGKDLLNSFDWQRWKTKNVTPWLRDSVTPWLKFWLLERLSPLKMFVTNFNLSKIVCRLHKGQLTVSQTCWWSVLLAL